MIDLIFPRCRHRFAEADRLHVLIDSDRDTGPRAAATVSRQVADIQPGDLVSFLGRCLAVERVG